MAGIGAQPASNSEIIKKVKLGLVLKAIREDSGKSQRDAAAGIGYANATFVCNVEKGASAIPIGKVADFAAEYSPKDQTMLAAAIIRYTQPETWATCISVFEPLFKSDKTKQTVTKKVDDWLESKFLEYSIEF
jgi:DNA-binding XRE family transcriptional regulator